MRTYHYEIRDASGKLERGVTQAADEKAVSRELQAKGYFVLAVRPAARTFPGLARLQREVLAPVFYPASPKALSVFFSSMKVMFAAGFNVVHMGETLAEQTNNPILKQAARDLAEAAKAGRPMTSVMRKYPSAFNEAAVAMVEAGEHSGMLERTVQRLTEYYDREFELRQMYRWQTFYPKILLIAVLLIPWLKDIVWALITGAGFTSLLWALLRESAAILLGIALLWYGFRVALRSRAMRETLDLIKLSLPWFGSLGRRMATARWARALSMLLTAGVPVQRALEAAGVASGNAEISRGMRRVAKMTEQGRGMAEAIATVKQIPRMAVDMLTTAEKAGSFELALDKIADYYESETDVGGKQTALVIGILLFLIIASVIAFIVISFWGSIGQAYSHLIESLGQ